MSIAKIRELLLSDNFVITNHARIEMKNDNVLVDDLISACISGEIIEDYPSAYPLPACLIFGYTDYGRPLHVCLSKPPQIKIITVYVPSADWWQPDLKTRKKVKTK